MDMTLYGHDLFAFLFGTFWFQAKIGWSFKFSSKRTSLVYKKLKTDVKTLDFTTF